MKIITSTLSFLSVLFFLTITVFISCDNNKNHINADGETTIGSVMINDEPIKLLVNQPFKNISQVPEHLSHLDPSTPKSYKLNSGTVINVPANAFVDVDGNPVTGTIDLKFTEIHSPAEIIASGIPMKFIDEDGKEQQMQSAGMFEIEGEQNQRPVRIAEGKTIEISLVSDVEGAYDFWSFDEVKGNWINEGAIEAKEGASQNITPTVRQNKIQALKKRTKNKPQKPAFSDANKLVFNDLDLSHCPDLKGQDPLVLIYVGTDESKAPQKNKWIRKPGIWHKKTIKPVPGKDGVYQLTLLGDKMYQIEAKAAPTALEIDKANADYQRELANYKAGVDLLRDEEALIENRKTFVRLAAVRGFGKYNYDVMWKRDDAVSLTADFEIEEVSDMVKNKSMVYLITDNGRTVVSLPQRNWDKFRFSPKADNKIVAILPDNTAAVFTETDFEEQKKELINAEGDEFVFSLDKREDKIESLEDLDLSLIHI